MAWFKRKPSTPEPQPPPGTDPVNTINVLGRLDSVVDRLEGVSAKLLADLAVAQGRLPRKERDD